MDKARLAELATGPTDETAIDAIARYHRFLDEVFAGDLESADSHRLRFYAEVSSDEIRAAEERLGLRLPPSYVEFVTEHGCFSGPGDEAILRRPAQLGVIADYFLEEVFVGVGPEDLAAELGTDADGVERLRNIVYFADGQYEGILHLFRLDGANPETHEGPIDTFDREDYYAYSPTNGMFTGRSMDRYVVDLVDFNVRNISRGLGIE